MTGRKLRNKGKITQFSIIHGLQNSFTARVQEYLKSHQAQWCDHTWYPLQHVRVPYEGQQLYGTLVLEMESFKGPSYISKVQLYFKKNYLICETHNESKGVHPSHSI